jgi:dephospho-CoA kinase
MSRGRFILGVTGGIATGKTSAMSALRRLGLPTLCSDDLAHAVLDTPAIRRRVIARYGPGVVRSGRVDRKQLGAIVFAQPSERKWLEKQIHPGVRRQLRAFIRKQRGLAAVDIPLLFESRLGKMVDAVLVVSSPLAAQLQRLRRRNGLDRRAALQRIQSQWPLALKRQRADFVILNHTTLKALRQAVHRLVTEIRGRGSIA